MNPVHGPSGWAMRIALISMISMALPGLARAGDITAFIAQPAPTETWGRGYGASLSSTCPRGSPPAPASPSSAPRLPPPTPRRARSGVLNSRPRGLLQLHHDADDGQDRVLRSWPLREDDEPPGHPQPDGAPVPRRDGEPGDGDGPDALLRPPASRSRRHRGHEGPPPALHRPRPGLLQ